jgi:hypothetical protein
MDNFSYTFSYMMERATIMLWYCMLAAFAEKTLEAEREKVKEAIGHEPTQETWQDYYALKQEQKNRQNTHQREIDREKLRRLVFGEDDSNSEAG